MKNSTFLLLTSFLPPITELKEYDDRDWKILSKQMSIYFCKYFSRILKSSPYTQLEIAHKLGYDTHVTISMIKNGKAKLPLEKAGQFADILGVDKKSFIINTLIAYKPRLYMDLQDSII